MIVDVSNATPAATAAVRQKCAGSAMSFTFFVSFFTVCCCCISRSMARKRFCLPLPSNERSRLVLSANSLAKAEVINFRWHDLRHCTASYLAMNGATMTDIAAILGHRTLDMVKRYAHLSDDHVSNVVASMNAKIFGGV